MQAGRHALAGTTILQLVPAMRDDPVGQAAMDIAHTLLQSGARALVAGDDGPLVDELRSIGGEWLPMPNDTANPLRIRSVASKLSHLISSERIDIIHAQSAGAAWSALAATHRQPVFLVTSFPDRLPPYWGPGKLFASALARGDRVIAPSSYISQAVIKRYKIPLNRVSVVPRAVATALFDPALVSANRIAAVQRGWGIHPRMRIVLAPCPIAPANGQLSAIEAVRPIIGASGSDTVFVFAGDDRAYPGHVRELRRRAETLGVSAFCYFVGECADMPAAFAAADVVVVPALKPPLSGHAAAEAQAMGRPVVTTNVGVLPENVLCPPRMREELRTGWLAEPGDSGDIARGVVAALALDIRAYEAMGARARQFAEFMFSPHRVAEAIRGVYTSVLARDG